MLDEARLLSTLGHPNIVRLFDANTVRTPEGLRGFFTMEYVAGGSLERLAAAHKSMVPRDLVAEVMTQIASGLAVAHDQDPPIVHRDVTLANVLIGYDGTGMRVRVSDFGLAKRADPFTHLASAQGTYAFMAPEVMRNQGYSCASDVWSVGVIAYLLLTNRFPFHQGERSSRRSPSGGSTGRCCRRAATTTRSTRTSTASCWPLWNSTRRTGRPRPSSSRTRCASAPSPWPARHRPAALPTPVRPGPRVRRGRRRGRRGRPRPGPPPPNVPSGRPRNARGGWPKKHSYWPARRGTRPRRRPHGGGRQLVAVPARPVSVQAHAVAAGVMM